MKTINEPEAIDTGPVITDRDLKNYLSISTAAGGQGQQTGIVAFRIVETGARQFQLSMDLTFKGNGYLMITARKTPRTWRDLQTLIDYIRSLALPDAPVSILLLREAQS